MNDNNDKKDPEPMVNPEVDVPVNGCTALVRHYRHLEGRIISLENRDTRIEDRLTNIEERLSRIEVWSAAHGRSIRALGSGLTVLDDALTTVEATLPRPI